MCLIHRSSCTGYGVGGPPHALNVALRGVSDDNIYGSKDEKLKDNLDVFPLGLHTCDPQEFLHLGIDSSGWLERNIMVNCFTRIARFHILSRIRRPMDDCYNSVFIIWDLTRVSVKAPARRAGGGVVYNIGGP